MMFLLPRQGCGQGAGVCLSRSLPPTQRLPSSLRLVQHHQLQWRVSRADQGQCQGQIKVSVKGRTRSVSRSVSRADQGQCQLQIKGSVKVSVNGKSRSDINTVSSLVIDECVCSVVYKN